MQIWSASNRRSLSGTLRISGLCDRWGLQGALLCSFADAQVALRVLNPDAHVLPIIYYSDGAELRDKTVLHMHPLLVTIGSFAMENMRKKLAYRRFGMLPELDWEELGFSSATDEGYASELVSSHTDKKWCSRDM